MCELGVGFSIHEWSPLLCYRDCAKRTDNRPLSVTILVLELAVVVIVVARHCVSCQFREDVGNRTENVGQEGDVGGFVVFVLSALVPGAKTQVTSTLHLLYRNAWCQNVWHP